MTTVLTPPAVLLLRGYMLRARVPPVASAYDSATATSPPPPPTRGRFVVATLLLSRRAFSRGMSSKAARRSASCFKNVHRRRLCKGLAANRGVRFYWTAAARPSNIIVSRNTALLLRSHLSVRLAVALLVISPGFRTRERTLATCPSSPLLPPDAQRAHVV